MCKRIAQTYRLSNTERKTSLGGMGRSLLFSKCKVFKQLKDTKEQVLYPWKNENAFLQIGRQARVYRF